jgi:hypothetical protein
LRPKKFQDRGKQKAIATTQQGLGSYSGDETKMKTMGSKCISTTISSSSVQFAKLESVLNQKKQCEIFHVRVIMKPKKIDTLFNNTTPHVKPYPLGWVCEDAKLQVTKQCKIRFAITSKFIDEVELDVVPLEIYYIVLGSPYLFDRKAIFYHEENKYYLFKDRIEYIVRAHCIKTNVSLVSTGKMKGLVSASKYFVLMTMKKKEKYVSYAFSGRELGHKQELVKIISNYDEVFHEPTGLPPKRGVEHEIYLQQDAPIPNIGVKQVFEWGGKQHKSFDTLKEKISTTPILALPDL